jgi:nucleotide-binding universal stress UspA family protein
MRFLFATDGSRGASFAEDFLLALPLGCSDEVIVLTVPSVSERESYALLSRIQWRFASRHVLVSTALRNGAPVDAIEAVALERAADLVVVGSRGRGELSGTFLGSVSRALARGAPAPVLVVRARREAPRRVLLALDGSNDARAAVRLMERLPLPRLATIEYLRLGWRAEDRAAQEVSERVHAALGTRVMHIAGTDEHAGEAVLREAVAASTDLIVLGSEGQTLGTGLLRTSVADHVLSHAPCAVLVAKAAVRPRYVEAPAARLAFA